MECMESKAETQANATVNNGNNRGSGIKPRGISTSRDNKRDPGSGELAKDMVGTMSSSGRMYG